MEPTCYFCNGIVSESEPDHILLDGHDDHVIYMHERCATGQNVVEPTGGPGDGMTVTCPECGLVETHLTVGSDG